MSAFGQHILENEITLRPAAPHQSNRLYDIFVESQHLIAKEYLRADVPDAAPHEYAALRYLQSIPASVRWWSISTWKARCGTDVTVGQRVR